VDSSVPFGGLWSLRSRKPKIRQEPNRQVPQIHTTVSDKTLYEDTLVERYVPKRVTNQSRALGTKLMRSEQWSVEGDTKVRLRGIPYVMPSGHLAGSVKLTWRCSANQWFTTVVRSVIEKISKRTLVNTRRKYKTTRKLTVIAVYYVLTNSDYFLERLLCCERKGFRKLITKLVNLDEPMRFCFDQALSGASWLELRGKSPRTVHKLYMIENVYTPGCHSRSRQIRTYVNALCDPWVIHGVAYTHGMCFLSSLGSV